jgi:hypothetical protein
VPDVSGFQILDMEFLFILGTGGVTLKIKPFSSAESA